MEARPLLGAATPSRLAPIYTFAHVNAPARRLSAEHLQERADIHRLLQPSSCAHPCVCAGCSAVVGEWMDHVASDTRLLRGSKIHIQLGIRLLGFRKNKLFSPFPGDVLNLVLILWKDERICVTSTIPGPGGSQNLFHWTPNISKLANANSFV
jgi:hypothetical protein